MGSDRAMRAFLRASDPEEFESPTHTKALFEETDVLISIRASSNVNERSAVDPRVNAAYSSTRKEVRDVVMDERWLGTQYPAPGDAQKAEMPTEAYEEFVSDAVLKDWDAQREHQQRTVEILDTASEVRIRSGETTDVRLTFEGDEVVDHAAEKKAVLTSLLETDEGARRLGELGIGMNRDIDRFTYDVLFDEKMGDSVP